MEPRAMRVTSGLRVGFWFQKPTEFHKPFRPMGVYVGPDLGDHIPGTRPHIKGYMK